ncbi:MAG: AzlC family ABC transporter permease [Ilumatobacteraceae bacterium]
MRRLSFRSVDPVAGSDDEATRQVVTASITLGAVVGAFGIVFGVGAVAAGGSVLQACVMSLLVFTGASQFTAVSVVDGGGSTGSALGGAMLLAARNGVYGLAMAPHLPGRPWSRLVAAQLTIDESTAMSTAQPTPELRRVAFWITGSSVYAFWNIGTLLGALAGSAIDPTAFGLDAAFPAGFVAMVAPHFRSRAGRRAGVLGAAICLVTVPFVPIGLSILCAGAAVLLGVVPDENGGDATTRTT